MAHLLMNLGLMISHFIVFLCNACCIIAVRTKVFSPIDLLMFDDSCYGCSVTLGLEDKLSVWDKVD